MSFDCTYNSQNIRVRVESFRTLVYKLRIELIVVGINKTTALMKEFPYSYEGFLDLTKVLLHDPFTMSDEDKPLEIGNIPVLESMRVTSEKWLLNHVLGTFTNTEGQQVDYMPVDLGIISMVGLSAFPSDYERPILTFVFDDFERFD